MRIVSLAKSNTEILAALGCAAEIVGATAYDKGNFEILGSYTDIDIPKTLKLRPDIAFTSTFLQEKYAKELEAAGVEVVHLDPLSVDGIMQDILTIGNVLGKEPAAKAAVAKMRKDIESVRMKVSELHKTRVYMEEWPRPPMAAGNWVVQMIGLAGGEGLLKQGERSREVSLDEVRAFSPEMVVLNWCGIGEKADTSLVGKRQGWDSIDAVRGGKIRAIDDSSFNTPSQNVVHGIKLLAGILHG